MTRRTRSEPPMTLWLGASLLTDAPVALASLLGRGRWNAEEGED